MDPTLAKYPNVRGRSPKLEMEVLLVINSIMSRAFGDEWSPAMIVATD